MFPPPLRSPSADLAATLMSQATWQQLVEGTHKEHNKRCDGCQRRLGRGRQQYLVHQLEDAITAVLHRKVGVRDAARTYRVPRSTLQDHVNPSRDKWGRVPGETNYQLMLAADEEKLLAAIMCVFLRILCSRRAVLAPTATERVCQC